MDTAANRLIRYAQVFSESDYHAPADRIPSTACQFDMAHLLVEELHAMGGEVIVAQDYANELELDCENGYLSWSVMDSEPVQVHAECVSGLIEVMIPESLKENGIRYDLEWEQGSITLPEEFLEGTGEKISGDGNGASGFYLESGPGGDISVLAEPV